MTTTLFAGTAGWALARSEWDRFPADGTHLQRYAARLDAVEINTSFYRPHRRETYARWAGSVPQHFRFAVKLPRSMTHERRLASCEGLIDRFAEEIAGLGPKRGPLLVQLPPSLALDITTATDFLRALSARCGGTVVCEPRHASWFTPQASDLLAGLGIARVAADPAPVPGADRPGGAPALVYFRLHGSPTIYHSDYDAAAIATLARRLATLAAGGATVWCIFDNTALGHALRNALTLLASLGSGHTPAKDASSVHSG